MNVMFHRNYQVRTARSEWKNETNKQELLTQSNSQSVRVTHSHSLDVLIIFVLLRDNCSNDALLEKKGGFTTLWLCMWTRVIMSFTSNDYKMMEICAHTNAHRTDAFALLTLHFESHDVRISTENYDNFKWICETQQTTHLVHTKCVRFVFDRAFKRVKLPRCFTYLAVKCSKMVMQTNVKIALIASISFDIRLCFFCSLMSMTFVDFHFPYLGTFCVTNNSVPCNVFLRFEYGAFFPLETPKKTSSQSFEFERFGLVNPLGGNVLALIFMKILLSLSLTKRCNLFGWCCV